MERPNSMPYINVIESDDSFRLRSGTFTSSSSSISIDNRFKHLPDSLRTSNESVNKLLNLKELRRHQNDEVLIIIIKSIIKLYD